MEPVSGNPEYNRDRKDNGSGIAREPAASSRGNAPKTRLTILLLEDNQEQADSLRDILRFAGYECVITRNMTQAREQLDKPDQRFDVMVADLNLAESDAAIIFIREARGLPRYTTLPVIIATGHDTQEAREQARLLGRTDYLAKPFAAASLLQLIARWTDANP
jgi:CheY-like chemotaxis protein